MSLREEIKRKGIHLTSSLVPLAYAFWLSRMTAALILAVTTAGMLFVESIRHRDNWGGRTFRRFFGAMLRDAERGPLDLPPNLRPRWLGGTPYCIASFICVVLFPKPVAVLALLYLAVGDTAASFVGKLWGRTRIVNGKSLEGTIGCFVACALVAFAAANVSSDYRLWLGILGALAAALAELLITKIDDNYSIPLASGTLMAALTWMPL